jgi:hypothetical protein
LLALAAGETEGEDVFFEEKRGNVGDQLGREGEKR